MCRVEVVVQWKYLNILLFLIKTFLHSVIRLFHWKQVDKHKLGLPNNDISKYR